MDRCVILLSFCFCSSFLVAASAPASNESSSLSVDTIFNNTDAIISSNNNSTQTNNSIAKSSARDKAKLSSSEVNQSESIINSMTVSSLSAKQYSSSKISTSADFDTSTSSAVPPASDIPVTSDDSVIFGSSAASATLAADEISGSSAAFSASTKSKVVATDADAEPTTVAAFKDATLEAAAVEVIIAKADKAAKSVAKLSTVTPVTTKTSAKTVQSTTATSRPEANSGKGEEVGNLDTAGGFMVPAQGEDSDDADGPSSFAWLMVWMVITISSIALLWFFCL